VALRNALLGLKITDTQCGFKAMKRTAALEILDCLHLYHPNRKATIQGPSVTSGFDVEFLFVAQRLGYRVAEVPVQWNYQDTRRVRVITAILNWESEGDIFPFPSSFFLLAQEVSRRNTRSLA
jgi:hypothetical protein